jgi:hypothetical protein
MAESDRQRLLARALALPTAEPSDFFGDRRPPEDADPALLKRINDTGLRTKLVETGIAEGLQSPKGPQKIASLLRIYPAFDAPAKTQPGARAKTAANAPPPQTRGLPSVDQMERLLARYREIEHDVAAELATDASERIARLKRALADLEGPELDAAYRELGEALDRKRALAAQIRFETFARIERDGDFAERAFLRLLARA